MEAKATDVEKSLTTTLSIFITPACSCSSKWKLLDVQLPFEIFTNLVSGRVEELLGGLRDTSKFGLTNAAAPVGCAAQLL
jgi:hypothetical protein